MRPRGRLVAGALPAAGAARHQPRAAINGEVVLRLERLADAYVPFILLSTLLMVLGMGMLGIGTLLGRQLRGWQVWMPLPAGGCPLLIAPTYSIDLYLHFILLGLWGLPWLLLGYVVFSSASIRRITAVQAAGMQ